MLTLSVTCDKMYPEVKRKYQIQQNSYLLKSFKMDIKFHIHYTKMSGLTKCNLRPFRIEQAFSAFPYGYVCNKRDQHVLHSKIKFKTVLQYVVIVLKGTTITTLYIYSSLLLFRRV